MDCSTSGFTVLHYLSEFIQSHVHKAVMPSNHLILCRPLLNSCSQSLLCKENGKRDYFSRVASCNLANGNSLRWQCQTWNRWRKVFPSPPWPPTLALLSQLPGSPETRAHHLPAAAQALQASTFPLDHKAQDRAWGQKNKVLKGISHSSNSQLAGEVKKKETRGNRRFCF